MIQITLNGQSRETDPATTVQQLLDTLGLEAGRVAVELNQAILARNRFAETSLHDGDTLEIVQFVGGG